MRVVKRVSLFFLYSVIMMAVGFGGSFVLQEYFYPGKQQKHSLAEETEAEESVPLEAASYERPVITADTEYLVLSYDMLSGAEEEMVEVTPDKFIGLDRQKLELELKEYAESPSLTDLEKGFSHIELLSFSPSEVVVRKSYKKEEGFFLLNENHYVVVYDKNLNFLYMNTGILTEELPEDLQNEVIRMKFVENESELYHFLESYSS